MKATFEKHADGRGLKFSVKGFGEEDIVLIPGDLLDDEVGDGSTDAERQSWVEANLDEIVGAYEAKAKGGFVRKPFDRILVLRKPR